MESFIIYLGKVAIAAGLFYIVYLILFQNHKQFTFNRIYLPVSLALSFLIPLITFTTVKYVEPVSTNIINSTSFVTYETGFIESGESAFFWYHYLLGLYVLGTLFFSLHFLSGYFKALSIVRRGETQRFFEADVCVTEEDVHPFSFFNKIVISKHTLNHPDLKMIVNHENIHVKEKHTIDILFTEFMFIAQWFNPFAWLIKDAVKNNLEYMTDNQIVQNHNPQDYQLAMLTLADKNGVAPFLTALNGSQLKNRIIMMKKKTENKYAFVKQLVTLPLLAILIMGLSNKEVKTEVKESIPTSVASTDTTQVKAKKSNEEVQHVAYPTQRKVVVGYPIEKDVNNTEKVEVIAYGRKSSNTGDHVTLTGNVRVHATRGIENPSLYVVDGKIVDEINNIDASDVESISVLKGVTGTELYGKKGKNGVVLIKLKEPSDVKSSDGVKVTALGVRRNKTGDTVRISEPAFKERSTWRDGNSPLFVVDGKIVAEIDNINPNQIESISVLKDETATNKYGDKGKNGVIEIALKDSDWKEPVYFLDGKEVDKGEAYKYVGRPIVKETVRLKKEDAIAKYGKKGENGVVEIYTKKSPSTIDILFDYDPTISKPLFILDGKEETNVSINQIDPEYIKSVNILKGETATNKYGDKAKNGVIEVTTKLMVKENKFITTISELHRALAINLKYPVEAQEKSIEGKVTLYMTNSNGENTQVTDNPPKTDITLDEIIVTATKNNNDEPAQKDKSDILFNEVKRVVKSMQLIEIPEFKDKTVAITVRFVLQ